MAPKAQQEPRKKKASKTGNGASLVSFQRYLKENKNLTPAFDPNTMQLTMEEVSKHNTRNDCWTVYRGEVYNIGPFLDYHPGGEEELMRGVGVDCTGMYNVAHSWVNAPAVMGKLKLGPLVMSLSHPPEDVVPAAVAVPERQATPEFGADAKKVPNPEVTKVRVSENKLTIKTSSDTDEGQVKRIKSSDLIHNWIAPFKSFNAVRLRKY